MELGMGPGILALQPEFRLPKWRRHERGGDRQEASLSQLASGFSV